MAHAKSTEVLIGRAVGLLLLAAVITGIVYIVKPELFKTVSGFQGTMSAASNYSVPAGGNATPGATRTEAVMSNPEVAPSNPESETIGRSGPADFGNAESPSGCYPRDQLTPSELLPKDTNSVFAEQNPMGTGSLKGKNFLSAGALIGVNTVGQSLRNANYQLRSEPPNPQVPVSVFLNSTIEPDVNRRSLEIA